MTAETKDNVNKATYVVAGTTVAFFAPVAVPITIFCGLALAGGVLGLWAHKKVNGKPK